jgi:hypothetical protein
MKSVFVTLSVLVLLTGSQLRAADAQPDNNAALTLGQRLFKGMDKDTDGAITSGEARGPVKTQFDRIDADSNGRITPRELHAAIVARAQRQRESRSAARTPGGFQRPQPRHRTSRPVPTPWLGYGHDDAPAVRGATYLKSPEEIRAMVGGSKGSLSYPKGNGLRIVGTGHSWMAPGYRTLPQIAAAAGLEQRLRTHTSAGESGAARVMWERENGILGHQGRPQPKCMAAITTGEWDVMMWGSYTNDRPEYYLAWIDFCLKFNPKMEFYVFNAWPQYADGFADGDREPRIENFRARAGIIHETYTKLVTGIDRRHPDKVHILPTCDAMMAALELYFQRKLPGVEGLNRQVDGKSPSIWSDGGHLGVGMDRLEGYVFYATLYQKSPELIKTDLPFHNNELDRIFRKIAWQAVVNNPLSDVTDKNGNGIGDQTE